MTSSPIALRAKTDHDLARIFKDWLQSARNAPGYAAVPNETYYWNHHRLIETLWIDPTALFVVACDPNDPTKIFGWLCGQRADTAGGGDAMIVHYVYVVKRYRRLGIASALLKAFDGRENKTLPVVVTAISPAGRELLGRSPWIFNPYILWARVPLPGGTIKPPPPVTGPRGKFWKSRNEIAKAGFSKDEPAEEQE
jgi:GNAT superfamily N-acetyltransferase